MTAKLFALFIICVWVFLDKSISIEGRRQVCADGSYELEGRTCCLCTAGQRVKEHCTPDSQNDGQCEHCENGTYNSVANFQETCQPCTSCSHPNANLEEEEPCTIVRNTKCRCKKHHFCSSKECTICQSCKICGFGGIKADCTATSDTVCNDAGGAIAGIVVLVFILVIGAIVAAGYVVIRRKTRDRNRQKEQVGKDESGPHVELDVLLPAHSGERRAGGRRETGEDTQ
ncbi:tumor necrosis factor receptor superfamily member 6-like [Archocentrus centrarchus]|uniref:tumor necrosis factor receptor superfamily member 6-like n=1 Tax=Archocentrus centrarchus TaxID=63155 RepID=UPI0011EA3F57|nr:tumor necrosis factor receptor superfamily member 6-like [Archocentrus centrarchus]